MPAPKLATLRTEFSTYLCFDAHAQALVHRPAQHMAGYPLVCTTAKPSQLLCLVCLGEKPAVKSFPLGELPLTHLDDGKILLGRDGAQLAVATGGGTVIQEEPAGLSGQFSRESIAETLANGRRRKLSDFRVAIFTAAGDRHQIPLWLRGGAPRDFALIAAYYGASDETFAQIRAHADIAVRATGGKFQILKTLARAQPGLFAHFDYILVADDDLIWNIAAINRAFHLAQKFDLWLCQPAFDTSGRVSFTVTRQFPGPQTLRYVNFVEMTCPIFRTEKLFAFLNIFDGSMSGYGVDFWFCDALGGGRNLKFAILDEVTVLNPNEADKAGGEREIDKLRPLDARIEEWQAASRNYNLKRISPRIFGTATLDPAPRAAVLD